MKKQEWNIKPVIDAWSYAIYEEDNRIFFVNYEISEFYILNFVLTLLSGILFVNGIVQLFFYPMAGIFLLILAIFSAILLHNSVEYIKRVKAKPLEEQKLTGIIDLDWANLLNEEGKQTPLGEISIETMPQLFSSSLMIVAKYPDGYYSILMRGNPFSGWSWSFSYYLKKKWLMK